MEAADREREDRAGSRHAAGNAAGEPAAPPELVIACLRAHPRAVLPERMTAGASGFDLHACLDEPLVLAPGRWAAVPTGLVLEIPPGYEGMVRARSGLAARHGIGVLNGPGTIDSDYRGEVKVLLMNWGEEPFRLEPGDRVAQIVFAAVPPVRVAWAESLGETVRGSGGFGHTGARPPGGRE